MPIRVVAAVVIRDDRLLLCQRPEHKRHGGLWEFPGGKLEDGESDFQAAARELEEELAVDVRAVEPPVFSKHDPGSEFVIEFMRVEIGGEPQALEHIEVRWVTVDEAAALPLAPSDRAFLNSLLADGIEALDGRA
jgi:mutator protein MutT